MNTELKYRIIRKYGSQANFAESISVDETIVSRIVRGRRKLNSAEKRRWAESLGCSVSEI